MVILLNCKYERKSNRACQVTVVHVYKYRFKRWSIRSSVNLSLPCESLCLRGQRRRRRCSLCVGSLLKCTDQSDFPICLANEMMTYGGNMNSFDEASFLMQSSGLEGGACVCICVSVWVLLPAGTVLFQQLSSSYRKTMHVCA